MNFLISNFVANYRERASGGFEGRDTLTPVSLAKAMGGKVFTQLPDDPEKLMNMTFVDPACGTGIFGAVVADYLNKRLESVISDDEKRIHHIVHEQIWMYDKSFTQVKAARELFPDFFESKIIQKDTLNEEWPMEFDVILGNPPYEKKVGPDKTEPIWYKFDDKSFANLKDGGVLSYVHSSSWREPYGRYKEQQKLLTENEMSYLSLNTREDGQKVFNATIAFDWYVVRKNKVNENHTTIEFSNGEVIEDVDVTSLEFIPNKRLEDIKSILAGEDEESVKFIHSWSDYETRDPHVFESKDSDHEYPVVYSITQSNGINLKYTSTKSEGGGFGVPKVIVSNGTSYPVIDEDGKYGLTQFAFAIADDPENLQKIKRALESKKFLELMKSCKIKGHRYSKKILSLLRKDFWKEFVDEE